MKRIFTSLFCFIIVVFTGSYFRFKRCFCCWEDLKYPVMHLALNLYCNRMLGYTSIMAALLFLVFLSKIIINSCPVYQVVADPSRGSKLSRRIASLVRFREKRKERCFEKKIRYSCRKEVAQR